jgi:HKD family nuclease
MTKISPLFDQADQIAIVAAFVREPGLRCIQENILRAVSRGARVQVLTGDYLGITQPSALEMLLDWSSATRATTTDNDPTETPSTQGTLEARVIETQKLPKGQQSFHPKSWRFERSADCWGVAFVGSSNLSRSALCAGIEWNLGITRVQEPIHSTRSNAHSKIFGKTPARWMPHGLKHTRRACTPNRLYNPNPKTTPHTRLTIYTHRTKSKKKRLMPCAQAAPKEKPAPSSSWQRSWKNAARDPRLCTACRRIEQNTQALVYRAPPRTSPPSRRTLPHTLAHAPKPTTHRLVHGRQQRLGRRRRICIRRKARALPDAQTPARADI